jgi:hypothetical protein
MLSSNKQVPPRSSLHRWKFRTSFVGIPLHPIYGITNVLLMINIITAKLSSFIFKHVLQHTVIMNSDCLVYTSWIRGIIRCLPIIGNLFKFSPAERSPSAARHTLSITLTCKRKGASISITCTRDTQYNFLAYLYILLLDFYNYDHKCEWQIG